MAADIVDSSDDGTQTTVTYSDGSVAVIDDASGMTVSQSGPSFDSSSQGTSSAPTIVKTATANGNTYYQMSDGTYQMVDEAGNIYPSNATDFTNANTGGVQTSTASTATGIPGSTITSSGATGLSGLIAKAAAGTLSSSDIASFAAANAGNIAALTGLAALTGGNNVTTGAYQGKIPTLQAIRNQVNAAVSPNQSQQYFTDTQYVNPSDSTAVANANAASTAQAQAIIAAAQKQAAERAAAQQPIPGFAMPWVNQTAAGNTPVTAANNAGLPAVINVSSPGYTGTPTAGVGTPSTTAGTTTSTSQTAAQLAAQQEAAKQAALLAAQQKQAALLAAQKAAAAATLKQQQTDIGNIVAKYPNYQNDPVQSYQMQVAVSQYMDQKGISPSQLPSILAGTSYNNPGWTPTVIANAYKNVDPVAQVVSLYQSGASPAAVNALATKNGITLQQMQQYGLSSADINNLAAKGYVPTNDLSTIMANDWNNGQGGAAGLQQIQNIINTNNLTAAQIQAMYPGIDLNQVASTGIKIPGYTPTSSAAPATTASTGYTPYSQADILNYINQQGIANNPTALAAAEQQFNGDPAAVAQALATLNQPASTSTAPAVTGGAPAAVQAAPAAPAYNQYSQSDIINYIQSQGIANDPNAIAAAVQQYGGDPAAAAQALATINADSGAQSAKQGGIMGYAHGGTTGVPRYLQGTTDGMADEVPSSIDGVEPAKLSHGEFVIPADVVSHLGNGNSDAGAKKLYQMMDKVRMARTGTKKQGKEINPDKFLVGGPAYANGGAVAFNTGGISDIKGYAGTTGSTVSTGTSSGVSTPSIGYSTVNALSPWAGDYVTNMLGSAQALAQTPMPVYQGELTAGPSSLQQQQFAGLSALAQTGAPPVQFQTGTWSNQGAPTMPNLNTPSETSLVSQAGQGNTTGFGQPLQLDTSNNTGIAGQYMNPYLQQSLQPQLNQLAYTAGINEQNDLSKLTQAGAFGGSRQAVLQGIDQGNLLAQQATQIGQGYNTAYNQAMQQFNNEQQNALTAQQNQQAANQASANFGLQSLNALGTAGATQQGLQQAADTAAQNQFNTQALYPYQQLQFEQSMLSNLPISTQAVIPNTSTLGNIAGAVNTSTSLAQALANLGQG